MSLPESGRGRDEGAVGRGLTSRIIVASALLASVIASAFGFLLLAVSAERDAGRQARASLNELTLVSELERLTVDLETGLRGFVITRQERFLEPFDAARKAFPDHADSLVALTDDPGEDPLARQIKADIQSYIDDYALPTVDAVRRDDPSASSLVTTEEGKQRLDDIRAEFDRYRDLERTPLASRESRALDFARWALIVATGGLIGSVVLIIALVVYLSRAIVRPVRHAAGMAGRVAGGDLAVRMPETAAGEVGSLARSFNSMAVALETNRDDLRSLADEQAALRRVATLVAQGVVPTAVFDAVAAEVEELLAAESTWLLRYETDGTATIVAAQGRFGITAPVGTRLTLEGDNVASTVRATGQMATMETYEGASGHIAAQMREIGLRCTVGVPIVVEDRLWGLVIAAWTGPEMPTARVQVSAAESTKLVGTAVANAESTAELSASRSRLVAAADETRQRIERDLHDGTQQRLVSVGLQLRSAQAMVPAGQAELAEQLSQVAEGMSGALSDLQEISRGIHPAILSRGGLGPALKVLARRSVIPVELDLQLDRRLPPRVEVAVYYVVSEALTNAAKHARPSVVDVHVEADENFVQLSVHDDGAGGADPTRGSGLVGLRDRVEALGGKIQITSPIGDGTSISARIPLRQE